MKLASWNVNGIRGCIKNGFWDWFSSSAMDIICLQETRASHEQLTKIFEDLTDYHQYFACAEKKGYSGVAIFSHKELGAPLSVQDCINYKEFDQEGRTIILEYEDFYFVGAYFPNGQRDHGRVSFKLMYCHVLSSLLSKIRKKSGKDIIICGDFNTAHKPIDLANPAGNANTTGFLPQERQFLDQFVGQGFYDIFRHHHPEEPGHYTWWTYRNNCRERNIGWRIDYFFVTQGLLGKVKKAYLDPQTLGSDHCPLYLEML